MRRDQGEGHGSPSIPAATSSAPSGVDRRGGKILRSDAPRGAGRFRRRACSRTRSPKTSCGTTARQLAALAADAWSLLAVRKPGVAQDPARRAPIGRSRAPAQRLRCSRSSTTTCRSWSIRCWASSPSAALDVRFVVHPVFTVARDDAGRLIGFQGDAAGGRRAARKLHPRPSRSHRGRERAAPRSSRPRAGARRRARRVARLARDDWRASRDVIAGLKANPPPLAGRRDRRGGRSSWNGCSPTTSPSSACATIVLDRRRDALEPVFETGLGVLRSRELQVLRGGNELAGVHAGDHGVPAASRSC